MTPDTRIRELDAARGFCILAMVAVHLIYDLTELYPILQWEYPPIFSFLKDWGGTVFFLISGISATLGHRHLRRGLTVLGCAAVVSAVTRMAGMPVRFGVLHALAACMLLWQFFRDASPKALLISGIVFAAVGFLFSHVTVPVTFLYPLGLTAPDFASADFFPLLPYGGYFLIGAYCGKTLYRNKTSPFLRVPDFPFLCLCGRHSLFIYLIHQPVLVLLIELISA